MSAAELQTYAPAPPEFVRLLGLRPVPPMRADRARVLCPWHNEKHASCDVVSRENRPMAICRSCGEHGDGLSFAAAVWGMNIKSQFREVMDRFADMVGAPKDQQRPHLRLVKRDHIAPLVSALDESVDYDSPSGQRRIAMLNAAPRVDVAEALSRIRARKDAEEAGQRTEDIAGALDVMVDSVNDGDPREVLDALIDRLKQSGATQKQVDAAWLVLEARWRLDAERNAKLDAMGDEVLAEATARHERMRQET